MLTSFDRSYSQLNDKQKEAVDSIYGPLLVIAGPGTGKTELLSLRVANILNKTDVNEDNILCLTFSDSAAREMRSRLTRIIGPSASKITVDTYHGFGSSLIGRYPSYFPELSSYESASELLTSKVIGDITKNLPVRNTFKNYKKVGNLKTLISNFKQALLLPKDLKKVLEDNLSFIKETSLLTKKLSPELRLVSQKSIGSFAKLAVKETPQVNPTIESLAAIWNRELTQALEDVESTNSTKPLTAWKAAYLAKDADNQFIPSGEDLNKRLLDFLPIYEQYLSEMNNLERYDFDDMILKSIDILTKHKDLRFTLQEQYQFVLLDEYQDTNDAQARLVDLLADNPVNEEEPNLMAVGDDDQAIYSFQGASHSHMLDFINKYKQVKVISLDVNYRSTTSIVELSSGVAEQIETRITKQIDKLDKSFKANKKNPGQIKRISFEDPASHFSWMSSTIKKEYKDDYSKVAVIAPKHSQLIDMATFFQEEGIPINYERREDVLNDDQIKQLVTICRLIKAIKDNDLKLTDHLLSLVLNYDFWQLDELKIWQLSLDAYNRREHWLNLMVKDKYFSQIALFLIKLSGDSLSQKFDQLLEQVIGLSETKLKGSKSKSFRSPFYEFHKDNTSLIRRLFSSLILIRNSFMDFSSNKPGALINDDFIEFIDAYIASGLRMINTSPYIESSSSVNLMTAHKAKGQEFDTVYLYPVIDEVWGPSSRSGSNFLSLPANLKFIRRRSLDNNDERLRLFYVALSRAKDKLLLPSYKKDSSSKESTPLSFLKETGDNISPLLPKSSQSIATKAQSIRSLVLVKFFTSSYRPLKDNPDFNETLKELLADYTLSPSNLNTFIDVRNAGPKAFYNEVILKYPKPDSLEQSYGNAIHKVMEFVQNYITANNRLPALNSIQKEFTSCLKKSHLSQKEFEDLSEKGSIALQRYIEENKDLIKPEDLAEVNFKDQGITIGQAKITGKIDKILIDNKNKELVIADYKTGTPKKYWSKSDANLHLNQNQLYFYKLLAINSRKFKDYEVSRGYLDFTEPDSRGKLYKLSLNYSDQRLNEIKQLIEAVWKHVLNLDFPDVSKYSTDQKGIEAFEADLISGKI